MKFIAGDVEIEGFGGALNGYNGALLSTRLGI